MPLRGQPQAPHPLRFLQPFLQGLSNFLKNQLSGEIPESIGNLTELVNLNFGFNSFYGPIPESIGNLTKLEELYLSGNQIDSLEEGISGLYNLIILIASYLKT